MPPRDRTVIESRRFGRERARIEADARRIDAVLHGVTWELARYPERGVEIADGLRAYLTYPWPGAPTLVIYYRFSEDEVTLESLVLSADPPP